MSLAAPRTRYCSRCLTTFVEDGERCSNLGCRSARPAVGWGELMEGGELIDRTYRIHRRLAIGGAGVTYLAREVAADSQEFGPLLAVKVLYQQRDQGPYLRRLATEAQILQGLNHPQIVECRGFVHRSGHSPYLVTRFEAGGSLLDHLRRVGLLSPRVAAAVAMQVCDALAVAHQQGVIHRDLKPENVLLEAVVPRDEVPRIRVADFGIAKVFGGVGDRLTRVGAFIGTPQYAAPEQFEGVAPQPATDVYAVGALLYFCLTAAPVAEFMAELDPDEQREHLLRHLPPRLTVGKGSEPTWLNDTLAAAMTPDPGDRCPIDLLAERLHTIALGKDPGRIALSESGEAPRPTPRSSPSSERTGGSAARPLAGELSQDALPSPVARAPAAAPTPALLPAPAQTGPTRPPAVAARTSPTGSQLDLRPTSTLERMSKDKATTTSLGCLAVTALGFGALAMVAGAWWTLREVPRVLTGEEADPAAHADWQGIAYTLGERGVDAERVCKSAPYLALEVVVDEAGAVQSAALLNYPHEPTRLCVEAELQKLPLFPRMGKGLVRVGVQLPR